MCIAAPIFRLAFEEVRAIKIQRSKTASQRSNDEAFDVNYLASRSLPASALESLTPYKIQYSFILISQASSLALYCLSIALSHIGDKMSFLWFTCTPFSSEPLCSRESNVICREKCPLDSNLFFFEYAGKTKHLKFSSSGREFP